MPDRPLQHPTHDRERAAAAAPWWRNAVIYQIYPRSFQDTDGDGIGDLEGIRRRLDYLVWLGVDAVWISPFYPSPMADFGYDIADFTDIDPVFGDLAAFDRLLAEAHGRSLKVVLDFVPNHTSDQHPWFAEARASRDSPKRDWYVWRDGKPDGGPPNNWQSSFGGSAWTRDEVTGQFYYHAFLPQQPDLNWRNEAVVDAMHDALRFWLDRGVDGFRVDAITYLIEDELGRDELGGTLHGRSRPVEPGQCHVFTTDRPETHGRVQGMRRVLDDYEQRVLIGEAHLPVALVMRYYGGRSPGFDLPFNFILLHTPWTARAVEAALDQYLNLLPHGAWPNWVLGNHDEPRVATRIGQAAARVAAMLTMTLGGTPFLYNGDELGLENIHLAPDAVLDNAEKHNPGRGLGRDGARSPMPWDEGPGSGFTSGTPWLPVGDDNARRSVTALADDPYSLLYLYRRLIALRRQEPALVAFENTPQAEGGSVIAYIKRAGTRRLFVALNMGGDDAEVTLPGAGGVLLSTHLDRNAEACAGVLTLRGQEGVIVAL